MCDGQEFVESKWNCIFLPGECSALCLLPAPCCRLLRAVCSVPDSAAVLRAAPVLVLLLCVLVSAPVSVCAQCWSVVDTLKQS